VCAMVVVSVLELSRPLPDFLFVGAVMAFGMLCWGYRSWPFRWVVIGALNRLICWACERRRDGRAVTVGSLSAL